MDTVPPDFTDPFVSRYLAGFAVLALEGDLKARDFFIKRMTLMTETDWGIHNFPRKTALATLSAFGRSVDEVKVKQDASRTVVSCGKIKLSIDSFDHAELK